MTAELRDKMQRMCKDLLNALPDLREGMWPNYLPGKNKMSKSGRLVIGDMLNAVKQIQPEEYEDAIQVVQKHIKNLVGLMAEMPEKDENTPDGVIGAQECNLSLPLNIVHHFETTSEAAMRVIFTRLDKTIFKPMKNDT